MSIAAVYPEAVGWRELATAEPIPGCPYELHRWMLTPGETIVWAEELPNGQLLLEVESETEEATT